MLIKTYLRGVEDCHPGTNLFRLLLASGSCLGREHDIGQERLFAAGQPAEDHWIHSWEDRTNWHRSPSRKTHSHLSQAYVPRFIPREHSPIARPWTQSRQSEDISPHGLFILLLPDSPAVSIVHIAAESHTYYPALSPVSPQRPPREPSDLVEPHTSLCSS